MVDLLRARSGTNHATREGMTVVLVDDPEHARLRKLLQAPFSARAIERLRGDVQRRVDAHLDRLGSAGEAELIEDFAYPLPVEVFCDMLGIPAEQGPRFRSWTAAVARSLDLVISEEDYDACMALIEDMEQYLSDAADAKREHPADDVLSALIAAEVDGERLTHGELVPQLITLYVAGHEPTTALIGNGLVALFRHPEQLEALQADPSLVPQAVLEMLRYDGPNQFVRRVATDRDGDRRRRRSARATSSTSASAPPTTIPSAGATTPTRCASTGPMPASTCSSAAASTTASAPTWPACRPRSRSRPCSPGSPACARPATPPGPAAPPSAASAPSRSRSEGAGHRDPMAAPSDSRYRHFQSGSRFSMKAWRASALSSKPRRRAV